VARHGYPKGPPHMSNLKRSMSVMVVAGACALGAGLLVAPPAQAAVLVLGAGTYTADTTALTLTGPAVNVHGVNRGGVAVFAFKTITIPSGATIVATGSRPFELKASGALVLAGTITSDGTSATNFTAGPNPGGAGGGAGGVGGTSKGKGPGGGGVASDPHNGAGGGGFGAKGARGGDLGTGTAGAAGKQYGDLNVKLQGGSGGGGGSTSSPTGGGGGGGAVGLFGSSVTVQPTGVITVSGGNGAEAGNGASGGGSGGGIIIHANSVQLDGELIATGGNGGAGGCCGDGGGGAGGRIAIQYKSFLTRQLLIAVTEGGSSGTVGGSHGTQSPDATGGNGRLTIAQIDASKNVTLSTKLTDAGTGRPAAHLPVTLYKKAGGGWSKVATKTTSSTGVAKASVKLTKTTTFQWRFKGTLIHLSTKSPTKTINAH
jgi:hypothetical protein